ncbi:ATP-binding protein [Litchfieldella rifensis]|uniref:histidine kinase n=1 Tax=Litchfieldella rifensis TaxID=762643 RepID=A0ABV7LND2_9GAMM
MDSSQSSLLTLLADRIGLGLILLDQELRIEYWNDLIERCCNKPLAQAHGQPLAEIFPGTDATRLHQRVGQAHEEGRHTPVTGSDAHAPVQVPLSLPGEECVRPLDWHLLPVFHADHILHFALVLDNASSQLDLDSPREVWSDTEGGTKIDQDQLIEKLEKANNQLVQSEKLAAIGQLAAGVAHEINNPIGYVSSNLKTLTDYVQDLLRIIDAADEVTDIEGLQQLKRTLEYEYIRSDIESLISESGDGLERVKKIITALKDFSHIDEEKFRLADLHRGIDTTLNVVQSELKYKADVVKEYDELPEVECILSQINQVVMNLLVNSAHSIEEFGLITLRTGSDDEWAWFEVEDTGTGIEPDLLNRIYEPFFTTKPVGKGTGLGLALSYNIVQKHHGRIKVFSEIGKGTRFCVWLPIKQPAMLDSMTENETRT